MSDLSDLLQSQAPALAAALAEQLSQIGAEAFGRAQGGEFGPLLDAMVAHCAGAGPEKAHAWARRLMDQGSQVGLTDADVLTGIRSLVRVVRREAGSVMTLHMVLLAALEELDDATDILLSSYLEASRGASGEQEILRLGFADIVEQVNDFVLLATRFGKPMYLNRTGRQMIGLADDEAFPTNSLHDYHSDDSWTRLRDLAVPAVNRRDRWEGQCELRHQKSGAFIPVETTMLLVRDRPGGKPTGLALIHRDAARLREMEEALEEADSRKSAILESALDPIISIDHDGVIVEFNRAAEQVFGHSRRAVLGTKPSEVLFPPAKMAGAQLRIDRYLEVGEGSMLGKRSEMMAVRANGQMFPTEMAMTLNSEHGQPVMTFFIRDISIRKQAEEEQARHAAELERSNRELEQFAYVASHDLQEPLRKIRTFGDRLMMSCGQALDQTGRDCLERMQSAAERMQNLILGLLSLSRVTTKGQDFVQVDLLAVAEEAVSDLEVQIEASGGRVELAKMPTIQGDPMQIRQLFQNLIGNALKFRRPEESPLVKVSARYIKGRDQRPPIDGPDDEMCRIVVEDNGIGFEDKYAERIFGIFQRLHTRDAYEGTGIGLSVCRKIAERHGGTIVAHGVPGQGATFTVMLPVWHRKQKS